MKNLAKTATFLSIGVLLASCGGGGGPPSIDLSTLTNIRVEAYHASDTTLRLDPRTLGVGEPVTFVVTGTTTSGSTVTIPVSWTTTASSAVATITNSGVFLATSATSTGFDITASFGDQTRTISVITAPSIAHIGGRFVVGSSGVPAARLRIFGPSGETLGTAVSDDTGNFVLAVPTSARRVAAVFSNATGYSTTYGQGGFYYVGIREGTPDDGTCRIPLPTLSNNRRLQLGNVALFSGAGVPPPPPDGCILNP